MVIDKKVKIIVYQIYSLRIPIIYYKQCMLMISEKMEFDLNYTVLKFTELYFL
jgi:hypothetical protein